MNTMPVGWDKTWSHNFLLALDLWAALIFFNRAGITISTMCGLVRQGKDAFLKLWKWQRAILIWIEPRLGKVHYAGALIADRERAQFVLDSTEGDQTAALALLNAVETNHLT